jgi:hypothetical protein
LAALLYKLRFAAKHLLSSHRKPFVVWFSVFFIIFRLRKIMRKLSSLILLLTILACTKSQHKIDDYSYLNILKQEYNDRISFDSIIKTHQYVKTKNLISNKCIKAFNLENTENYSDAVSL